MRFKQASIKQALVRWPLRIHTAAAATRPLSSVPATATGFSNPDRDNSLYRYRSRDPAHLHAPRTSMPATNDAAAAGQTGRPVSNTNKWGHRFNLW